MTVGRTLAAAVGAALALSASACAGATEPEAAPTPSAPPAPADPDPADPTDAAAAAPGEEPPAEVVEVVEIVEPGDRKEAVGKRVRITGELRREKLGDSVARGGFDLLCPDVRAPDDLVGATVVAEGVLDRWETPVAEVAPDGAISQGTSVATTRYVLADCTLAPAPTAAP